jgi:hypothetical protein
MFEQDEPVRTGQQVTGQVGPQVPSRSGDEDVHLPYV